jgi:hypothetical protein
MLGDKEQRIKEIDKQIAKVGIIDAPGSIMVGLGLYAKFIANGDAFLPILNDQSFVNMILVFGAAIMIWGAYRTFTLVRERARIQKEPSL